MPTQYQAPYYTQTQIDNLEVNQMQFPYSDDYARYLGKEHQYEPTQALFNANGIDISKRLETTQTGLSVENFLKYVRFKFYLFVYSHSKSTRPVMNYIIAKRGIRSYPNVYEYRNDILNAMVYLGEYLLDNGDLTQIAGVDFDSMTALPIEQLRNEDRDYPARFRNLMSTLGLCYYGYYRIMPSGIGKEW